MRSTISDSELKNIEDRVIYHAEKMGRTLPEIRFFILSSDEFMSLLSKKVYPTSPVNIWEGKEIVNKRHRVETGQESSIYYEVVQTGNPSYAYLNDTNSLTMQASVMAHVIGHCEFSELNVLHDSNNDRTEFVMHLVNKVNLGRQQMGERHYQSYSNACESLTSLLATHSQHSLARTVETDTVFDDSNCRDDVAAVASAKMPFLSTLDALLQPTMTGEVATARQQLRQQQQEALNRRGYKLKAPCQDIAGFLRQHAPASTAERSILNYFYTVHTPHDFVIRTQIMNEGWAMYWEKKIMLELFGERMVTDVIDYSRVFSGVCYPRPFFNRNPYHLGYHMWNHIEELYRDGKVSLDYVEETDMERREHWQPAEGSQIDPLDAMAHLVRTVTDYEFLRRFLTPELVHEWHLNRLPAAQAQALGVSANDVAKADRNWVWLHPQPVIAQMLQFFTHFGRPRIYIIDTDFLDGGLLLYHRDDGAPLRTDWIKPTLKNLNLIWKSAVHLLSGETLHGYSAGQYRETAAKVPDFDVVSERIYDGKKPFRQR